MKRLPAFGLDLIGDDFPVGDHTTSLLRSSSERGKAGCN
jgi:hypothetical protein